MTTPATINRPCACGSYWYLEPTGDGQTYRKKATECAESTRGGTYHPGHDSKLVSLLTAAAKGGHQVFKTVGDIVTGQPALRWVAGEPLEAKVRQGLA